MELVDRFIAELVVLKDAPISLASLLLITIFGTYLVVQFLNKKSAEVKDERIEQLRDHINLLKEATGTESDDELVSKVSALKVEVDELREKINTPLSFIAL